MPLCAGSGTLPVPFLQQENGRPFRTLSYFMSYAVFKTGGKQYRVAEGDLIDVEKLDGERFIVPGQQDDDEEVGGTIANDEIDKDEET